MAKKAQKRTEGDELADKVDELSNAVDEDRERVVRFLEDLIASYPGEQTVGIAEYVAKLADALTRQNQVRLGVLKVSGKDPTDEHDDLVEEIRGEVGLPFEDKSDGSN